SSLQIDKTFLIMNWQSESLEELCLPEEITLP
ncbi:unnamed protein product, partial [marine sediment metagenome]